VVRLSGLRLRRLSVGQTLTFGARLQAVLLDGRRARASARRTNRGLEVSVAAVPLGAHALTIITS
jgi:hypothetical protein